MTRRRMMRAAWPWVLTLAMVAICVVLFRAVFSAICDGEPIVWKHPHAVVLLAGVPLAAVALFVVLRSRRAVLAFPRVDLVGSRGAGAWLVELPAALRVVAIGMLAVALVRPETYRTVTRELDSIDLMIVVDMSKSMEETDMPRDRLDAAQRAIRKFLRRSKSDRVGLVIFGQQAMLQCPLTHDVKLLEQIVADLEIGDVPELGTAIGDGLALALAQLRRSDAKSKVVILLSDGDSNWVTRFSPEDAARAARERGVKVYTLLVGREDSDLFGGMSVNPETLRNIADITGGQFFRVEDYETFERSFLQVREQLDKTKRTVQERVPDHPLYLPLTIAAALLVALELVLARTRLRRLP